MKKTTLLLTLGLCFGISGLAQTKKQPSKRPRTATKQSAKPKGSAVRQAKKPARVDKAKRPARPQVKRPQRSIRVEDPRPTIKRSAVKKPGRNSLSLPSEAQWELRDSALKASPLFVKLDTNSNGSISKREFQMMSNISKQLDTNKDKKLSVKELAGDQGWMALSEMARTVIAKGDGTGLKFDADQEIGTGQIKVNKKYEAQGQIKAGLVEARKTGNESAGLILPAVQSAVQPSGKATPTRGRRAIPRRKVAPRGGKPVSDLKPGELNYQTGQNDGGKSAAEQLLPDWVKTMHDTQAATIFSRLDINKDNKLSTAELFMSGAMTPQGDRPNP